MCIHRFLKNLKFRGIAATINMSGKSDLGAYDVPLHEGQSRGMQPQEARSFLFQIYLIVPYLFLEVLSPLGVTAFVLPKNAPGKKIGRLKRRLRMT